MKCKNTRYDHECHPCYAAMYGGYCLDCANAGVPDLDGQIADLRAQVFGHCGRAVSELTPERIREMLADADALAEENKTSEFASESGEEILARHCHELAAALAARDRQLAELREACEPFATFIEDMNPGRPDSETFHRMAYAGQLRHEITLGHYRRLAALLPPTAKGEQP